MKRVIGLIIFAMMVILPTTVNAAGYNWSMKSTQDDSTVTIELSITINNKSYTKIGGNFTLSHLTLDSITPESGWTYEASGNTLTFTNPAGITNGTYKIATIVFKKDGLATENDKCNVTWNGCVDEEGSYICEDQPVTYTETYTCRVVNGKYYGKNGTEVTEAVYNSECVTNPKTGSFLPYIALGTGLVLAGVVFAISRKNNKLYKI